MGHQIFYCAGELGGYAGGGWLIPALHFTHPASIDFNQRAFGPETRDPHPQKLVDDIYAAADQLVGPLREFVTTNHLDLIITENALTIPMNLPLGVALARVIEELGINTIAHHHDFYWERQRFQSNAILELLDTFFPPNLPTIQHVTINSIAQRRLKGRRGIDSLVVPNVHDFATPPPAIDSYTADFRAALGLSDDDLFILQPTRVIQRKGIELAIELVHHLQRPNAHLYITHSAQDEGLEYWRWLEREAKMMLVDLRLIDDFIGAERAQPDGRKIYSLWDAYPHANLVTYPSLIEGFGNALLETIYFKRLTVVNRYPVYNADIGPLGFEFIELDGFVDDVAIQKTRQLLNQPDVIARMAEKNYALAQEHFSLQVLAQKLKDILACF
jgi:glycosyltransferase involved in cell wall biosynthesis